MLDKIAIPWKDVEPGINDPVRNTTHEYLHFVNSTVFSAEARRFLRYGYYTQAPPGTKDHIDYWDEQERRCLNGYSVGGVRVTGRHYFYLNFCQIKARPIDINTGREEENSKKIITFPRFLDHNYYFFHELEECFAEGPYIGKPMHGMVALKSRRKGFTYQVTGGIYNYNFQFVPAGMNVLAAYQKLHYKVTLDGIHFSINHINRSTDWAKRRSVLNKRDHFRASFQTKNDLGMDIEEGYMSEIQAVSFKDDPFKSIGESNYFIGFEEAGKFEHLLTAYSISEPTLRDGDVFTGVPLFWGTGGDIEKGAADLAELFYKPSAYGCKSYENIYDENAVGDCGWFIDDMWYYPGSVVKEGTKRYFVDAEGNSIRDLAEESLDLKRIIKRKGSRLAYQKFVTQQPKNPGEALLRVQGNRFDAMRAQARLATIMSNTSKYLDSIWIGKLEYGKGNSLKFLYDHEIDPMRMFPIKDNNNPGALEIYEHPIKDSSGNIPYGRYIFGVDPYDDDYSTTDSVGSIVGLDTWTDRIVCHYKGRPEAVTFYNRCLKLIKYYNGIANYEKNKKGLYGFFYNQKATQYLCDEPEILHEKGISKANIMGNNRKGTNATTPVNAYGLELLALYLETAAYDEEDSEIWNMDQIRSVGILKEVIGWNPDGNFDDISALSMLMILREDRLTLIKKGEAQVGSFGQSDFWDQIKHKRLDKYIKNGRTDLLLSASKARYESQKQEVA